TRKYVEDDLRREYSSAVFYADDAFSGLHYMESLVGEQRAEASEQGRVVKEFARAATAVADASDTTPSAVVQPAPDIPQPPFWGVRVRRDFDLPTLFEYINETALFKNQWQLKTASQEDYARLVEEKYRPILKKLEDEVMREGWFEPKVVYGFFPCQSEGNDVIVYEPAEGVHAGSQAPAGLKEIQRFTFPRQREGRRLCISDFFLSKGSGRVDVI